MLRLKAQSELMAVYAVARGEEMRNVLSLARALDWLRGQSSRGLGLLGNEGGAAHQVKLFSGDPPAV
jgi:hypothetical protein